MPRGYKVGIVDGKKCMVKDPEQEEMVNAFYDYFEKHQAKQQTLRFIQRNYDPAFSYGMLRTMLSSEFYKGTYRGIPYCPAYLSEERWAHIQNISKKYKTYTIRKGLLLYRTNPMSAMRTDFMRNWLQIRCKQKDWRKTRLLLLQMQQGND